MRFFNTAGPVNPKDHYYVPHRINEQEVQQLIAEKKYFILHAPRQSGKTTSMREFAQELNKIGKYKALYFNVEPAQMARGNIEKGMKIILEELRNQAKIVYDPTDPIFAIVDKEIQNPFESSLKTVLQHWSVQSDKPIVLFIDEIDALIGDTLVSVLRQLRAGYNNRPDHFPQSACLFGVRDVRDYRIWSDEDKSMVLGGSAFNIKAESLTLPNFSLEQTRDLYLQHSHETGQQFTDEAIEYAFYLTQGQPWLVNALAYQACFKDVTDRTQPIIKDVIERAKETLILRRDTHIDQLVHKLEEPRVRHIIDSIIAGKDTPEDFPIDDISYVTDLGLIARNAKSLTIANPIYQEIIPRELSYSTQLTITQQTFWYQNQDGSLNMHKILESFTQFYRENSQVWLEKFAYKEAGPHLLLMAFLQRIINGGGKIHQEYALGRKRVDLLITFGSQRIVVELKVRRDEKTLAEGLMQTIEYMTINNSTEAHLVIFDPRSNKTWDEKVFQQRESITTYTVNVWGM